MLAGKKRARCDPQTLRMSSCFGGKFPWLWRSLHCINVLVKSTEQMSITGPWFLSQLWNPCLSVFSRWDRFGSTSMLKVYPFFGKKNQVWNLITGEHCILTMSKCIMHTLSSASSIQMGIWGKMLWINVFPMHIKSSQSEPPSSERNKKKDLLSHAYNPSN